MAQNVIMGSVGLAKMLELTSISPQSLDADLETGLVTPGAWRSLPIALLTLWRQGNNNYF